MAIYSRAHAPAELPTYSFELFSRLFSIFRAHSSHSFLPNYLAEGQANTKTRKKAKLIPFFTNPNKLGRFIAQLPGRRPGQLRIRARRAKNHQNRAHQRPLGDLSPSYLVLGFAQIQKPEQTPPNYRFRGLKASKTVWAMMAEGHHRSCSGINDARRASLMPPGKAFPEGKGFALLCKGLKAFAHAGPYALE